MLNTYVSVLGIAVFLLSLNAECGVVWCGVCVFELSCIIRAWYSVLTGDGLTPPEIPRAAGRMD